MVTFVLGGGGLLGAVQVGMLAALVESGVRPHLIVGTSIGAINGALFAASPDAGGMEALKRLWTAPESASVFAGSAFERISLLARKGTHAHSAEPLRAMLIKELGDNRDFSDLAVPFQCVAASIERSAEHWFSEGPLVQALLASSAVPGLFPPVQIGDEHYLDGGLVHSIPLGRATALGATEIYVLHVGRVDRPLTAPRKPWEVAAVAFEIARRHRYTFDLAATAPDVAIHVMPTGDLEPPKYSDLSSLRYRDSTRTRARMDAAQTAGLEYLRAPSPLDKGAVR